MRFNAHASFTGSYEYKQSILCKNDNSQTDPETLDPKLLNNTSINETGSRGSLAWPGRQTHNLSTDVKSGVKRAKRPLPEVAGSNPAPLTEQASVRANGTKSRPHHIEKQNARAENRIEGSQ
jgi:hypothetical protein